MGNTGKKEEHALSEILINVAHVATNSNLDLRDILDTIAHAITNTLDKDVCSICLLKPDKRAVCLEVVKGKEKGTNTSFCLTIKENDLITRAARDLQPIMVEDISKDPRAKAILRTESDEYLSLLTVPVIRDGTAIGLLTVQTRGPHIYGKEEVHTLTVISHNISVAVHNAELYKNVKTQLDELKSIHEIGNAITSILNMDDLLPYICNEVSKLFNATGCILRLLEDDSLQIKASSGLPENIREKMTLRIGEGIAGCVANNGEPLLIDNVSRMPENLHIPEIEATSVLCVPLKIGGRIIGTLGLYDKKDEWGLVTFTENDLKSLKTFASASSIAIENARLYRTEMEKEEKILSLYWDVTQTKDYLKSIIDNSADAIIISDPNGIITSWNRQAQIIYGFTEKEALGRFLPMVPQFLIEEEKRHLEKIMHNKTISNLETVRIRKDGKDIEVSLTLSPILDSSGNITGISGISRDISEKKMVEKELKKRNQELLRLSFINSVIRSTLDLDKLIRMVLTVITMGDGLGFNRAVLFLADEHELNFKGVMGVGPANATEAEQIWHDISQERKTLGELISDIEKGSLRTDSYLDRITQGMVLPLDEGCVLFKSVTEKKLFNIRDAKSDPGVNPILIQALGTESFGVVPLITRDRAIGVVLVDNLFTGKPIKDEDLEFLMGFTSHIASAIENAKLFESVSLAESELKNIFESISDMVYFTDRECTIKHINQAVVRRIGKPESEIIGQKCYRIFHGMHEVWDECPHSKVLETGEPCIEEVYDPHLSSTFLISNSPINNLSGDFSGTVHIARDITELHSLRERVISSERMAALGELAARVAHEIRNPLISVGGFARRLEKRLTGDTHQYAKIIVEEVTRLEHILKEILGFVRGGQGPRNALDINDIISEIVNFISLEIQERGNRITTEMSESSIIVNINPDRIKEAILNIIKNANKATDHGVISIKTRIEDKEAVIEISDTGCGISPGDRKNIFNPFFTTNIEGTGLGLAVTHKIIEEHNGRINVESLCENLKESDDGRISGTTFRIYLPLEDTNNSN
jgi:PAS domain S-box-containing protein